MSANLCEIKNLKAFLEQNLGKPVLECISKPLTKPGDNYGAELQAVEVTVPINGSDEREILHLVAKTSVTDPGYIDVFQPTITCVKENRFYSDIVPSLVNLQRISNVPESEQIDCFIRYFGSRISLNDDAGIADNDALLLLENTKVLNYVNGNRLVGFDTDETLAVMKSLAQFHALCIAVRRLQPDVFNTKISPYLKAVNMILDDEDTRMLDSTYNELKLIDGLDDDLRAKVRSQLKIGFEFARNTTRTVDTPYTTVVHRDLWVNNVMIKKDKAADKPIQIKIYDFQLYFYNSFVHDLIFFLCTSVRHIDLSNNFKLFIESYIAEFVKTLKLVNCPLDDYSFEKMWAEIQTRAKIEMLHVLFLTKICYVDLSTLEDNSPDAFYNWKQLPASILSRWELILKLFKDNGFI